MYNNNRSHLKTVKTFSLPPPLSLCVSYTSNPLSPYYTRLPKLFVRHSCINPGKSMNNSGSSSTTAASFGRKQQRTEEKCKTNQYTSM